MNRTSQSLLDLKLGPITRAQRKKLKFQRDDSMIAYIEDTLKSKVGEFEDQGNHPKLFTTCSICGGYKSSIEVLHEEVILVRIWIQFNKQERIHIKVVLEKPPIEGLIMSTDGHLPTQSYQEGTSEPSMRNLNETLRDVEELKKDKSSDTMEQRVGDNLGGFNSPHHQRPFNNVSTYDMPVQNSHPFHEVGYQRRPQFRDGRRGEDTPKVAFKDHSKPKVEEKGKLITNPIRCFKCNGVGQIAINCPTKKTLVFGEDLNKGIVDKDASSEDQDIASFEADEERMSLMTIIALGHIMMRFFKTLWLMHCQEGTLFISTLQAQILSFEILKEMCDSDQDFKDIYETCLLVPSDKYLIHYGFFLF
ncbi:hypothetical protein M9H77_31032 [Catharanthus roseus]|uniref:Uncharacterized protein n=1 Tax=Catharanthus roseus TaxID=4058 RepID=A0ACB9ZYX1_CATRO|nr:hypothetical protein M9H77_31032 [Catharanthus roseus]